MSGVLSDEIWIKILSHLLPWNTDCLGLQSRSVKSLAEQIGEVFNLRRVCSRFNKIFLLTPAFSRGIALKWRCAQHPICTPSLLAWLQRYSCNVETLVVECCPPALEMVFGALVLQQRLTSLALGRFSKSEFQMVTLFTSLTELAMRDPGSRYLVVDISPLQHLSVLQKLSLLDGEYCSIALPWPSH